MVSINPAALKQTTTNNNTNTDNQNLNCCSRYWTTHGQTSRHKQQQEIKEQRKQHRQRQKQQTISRAQEALQNTSHSIKYIKGRIHDKSRIQCKLCLQSGPANNATEWLLTCCPKKPTPHPQFYPLDKRVTFLEQVNESVGELTSIRKDQGSIR